MDKEALFKLSYGLYVVSSFKGDALNGQIANTVFQVTSDPVKISVCLHKDNLTREMISASKTFSVAVLSKAAPFKFIGDFGFKTGRSTDKYSLHHFEKTASGCPYPIEYSIAVLEAKVVSSFDVGSHDLFIGEISDGRVLGESEPMTYDFYRNVIKGASPKNAPTFMKA